MNENSLKNLTPFVPGPDARRVGGSWPGWRKALRKTIGDGEKLYEALNDLALGKTIIPVYPEGHALAGQQVTEAVIHAGYVVDKIPIVIPVPPAVRKAAAAELLDRAFGKPVQVVLDLTPDGDGEGAYVPASDLTADEQAVIRAIAKRRMLVTKVVEAESVKEDDRDE